MNSAKRLPINLTTISCCIQFSKYFKAKFHRIWSWNERPSLIESHRPK